MPVNRVECPECGAGLKSAAGFKPGQKITCPKCETYFQVPAAAPAEPKAPSAAKTTTLAKTKQLAKPGAGRPSAKTAPLTTDLAKKTGKVVAAAAADDEDKPKKPKKKKKRKDDEDGWSYSKSWVRFAILGVLLVVLGVLGFLLYQKVQRDKEAAKVNEGRKEEDDTGRAITPDQIRAAREKAEKQAGFNSKTNPVTPPEPPPTLAGLKAKLVGTWVAKDGAVTHTLTYRADGTFSYQAAGADAPAAVDGQWTADELVQGPGLASGIKITRKWASADQKLQARFLGTRLVDHALPDAARVRQLVFEKQKG